MFRKRLLFFLLLSVLLALLVREQSSPMAKLAHFSDSLSDGQARAQAIRTTILTGAELDPFPEHTPLNPIFVNRRVRASYSANCAGRILGLVVIGRKVREGIWCVVLSTRDIPGELVWTRKRLLLFLARGSRFGLELLLIRSEAIRMKNGLGEIAENTGFFGREATLDHCAVDSAEHAINITGGGEFASGFKEIGSEGGIVGRVL